MFDLNCDGKLELIHRGGNGFLSIVNAKTGEVLSNTLTCNSFTGEEIPIIADINGDGQANILVGCDEGLTLVKSTDLSWKSARSVYNQFNYLANQVNDDLTVPCYQQEDVNSLSSQLFIQSGRTNSAFVSCRATLDIAAKIDTVFAANCDSTIIQVAMSICNVGDAMLSPDIKYVLYLKDSLNSKIEITGTTETTIQPDECITLNYNIANQNGTLIFSVNDDGSNFASIPSNENGLECLLENNTDIYDIANVIPSNYENCLPIFIPNSFSPDGDGMNDRLIIKHIFSKDIQFLIFDRTGKLVYQNDPLLQEVTWDGKYKGKTLRKGVYTYYLKTTSENSIYKSMRGNITLIN